MLREIPTARQVSGEPKRRWFTSSQCDLFIWVDDQDAPIGFQLCYDKPFGEHALTWTQADGFSHMAVDGGEGRPARHKGTPILVADGSIDADRILGEFLAEAKSLPDEFVQVVEGRLRELGSKGAV